MPLESCEKLLTERHYSLGCPFVAAVCANAGGAVLTVDERVVPAAANARLGGRKARIGALQVSEFDDDVLRKAGTLVAPILQRQGTEVFLEMARLVAEQADTLPDMRVHRPYMTVRREPVHVVHTEREGDRAR